MFSEMKKEIIEAGILLDRYELVSLTCGNLSVRMPTGEILVTPSGMMYEKMVEDDMIVMDIDGNVIEGTRKPPAATCRSHPIRLPARSIWASIRLSTSATVMPLSCLSTAL